MIRIFWSELGATIDFKWICFFFQMSLLFSNVTFSNVTFSIRFAFPNEFAFKWICFQMSLLFSKGVCFFQLLLFQMDLLPNEFAFKSICFFQFDYLKK